MFKFEKLKVWQKSLVLVDLGMKIVNKIAQKDQFSLGEQLRRALLSIPTNIAEGCGRVFIKESNQFYNIAKGSVYEVVSLIIIAKRRGYCKGSEFNQILILSEEIAKMLSGLMKKKSYEK